MSEVRLVHISRSGDTLTINCGNGKYIAFEMHGYCGPMPVNKNNDGIKLGARHPFWIAVTQWDKQGQRVNEDGKCLWHPEPKPITRHLGGPHYELLGYEPMPADIS